MFPPIETPPLPLTYYRRHPRHGFQPIFSFGLQMGYSALLQQIDIAQ